MPENLIPACCFLPVKAEHRTNHGSIATQIITSIASVPAAVLLAACKHPDEAAAKGAAAKGACTKHG
jgi:hypothetical protein